MRTIQRGRHTLGVLVVAATMALMTVSVGGVAVAQDDRVVLYPEPPAEMVAGTSRILHVFACPQGSDPAFGWDEEPRTADDECELIDESRWSTKPKGKIDAALADGGAITLTALDEGKTKLIVKTIGPNRKVEHSIRVVSEVDARDPDKPRAGVNKLVEKGDRMLSSPLGVPVFVDDEFLLVELLCLTPKLAPPGGFDVPNVNGRECFVHPAPSDDWIMGGDVEAEILGLAPPLALIAARQPGRGFVETGIQSVTIDASIGTDPPRTAGDLDGDGDVDDADLVSLVASLGSAAGEPDYLASADLNRDGIVSVVDAVLLGLLLGALSGSDQVPTTGPGSGDFDGDSLISDAEKRTIRLIARIREGMLAPDSRIYVPRGDLDGDGDNDRDDVELLILVTPSVTEAEDEG